MTPGAAAELRPVLIIALAVIGMIGSVFSIGFLTLFGKGIWALRGWVDSEEQRAKAEMEIASAMREFMQGQQEMNAKIWSVAQQGMKRMETLEISQEGLWDEFEGLKGRRRREGEAANA